MNLDLNMPNEKTIVIRDYVQTRFDTSSKPFLKEIVLLVAMYLFYVNVESKLIYSTRWVVISVGCVYSKYIYTNLLAIASDYDYYDISMGISISRWGYVVNNLAKNTLDGCI